LSADWRTGVRDAVPEATERVRHRQGAGSCPQELRAHPLPPTADLLARRTFERGVDDRSTLYDGPANPGTNHNRINKESARPAGALTTGTQASGPAHDPQDSSGRLLGRDRAVGVGGASSAAPPLERGPGRPRHKTPTLHHVHGRAGGFQKAAPLCRRPTDDCGDSSRAETVSSIHDLHSPPPAQVWASTTEQA